MAVQSSGPPNVAASRFWGRSLKLANATESRQENGRMVPVQTRIRFPAWLHFFSSWPPTAVNTQGRRSQVEVLHITLRISTMQQDTPSSYKGGDLFIRLMHKRRIVRSCYLAA